MLIPFALMTVWQGGWLLGVGAAAFALAMGYEWAGMSRLEPRWLLMGSGKVSLVAAGGIRSGVDA
ncbi:MAG: hypothetical protein AAF253_13165, partial [Pseudomonadota bacterium]